MKDKDILIIYFDNQDKAIYEARKNIYTLAKYFFVAPETLLHSSTAIYFKYPGYHSDIIIKRVIEVNQIRGMDWKKQCYIPIRPSWMNEDKYREIVDYCVYRHANIVIY